MNADTLTLSQKQLQTLFSQLNSAQVLACEIVGEWSKKPWARSADGSA